MIYLTFDAGYENGNTAAILEALKKHNAPAAFFLVGNYLETSPDLVRQMAADGHIVGEPHLPPSGYGKNFLQRDLRERAHGSGDPLSGGHRPGL